MNFIEDCNLRGTLKANFCEVGDAGGPQFEHFWQLKPLAKPMRIDLQASSVLLDYFLSLWFPFRNTNCLQAMLGFYLQGIKNIISMVLGTSEEKESLSAAAGYLNVVHR